MMFYDSDYIPSGGTLVVTTRNKLIFAVLHYIRLQSMVLMGFFAFEYVTGFRPLFILWTIARTVMPIQLYMINTPKRLVKVTVKVRVKKPKESPEGSETINEARSEAGRSIGDGSETGDGGRRNSFDDSDVESISSQRPILQRRPSIIEP